MKGADRADRYDSSVGSSAGLRFVLNRIVTRFPWLLLIALVTSSQMAVASAVFKSIDGGRTWSRSDSGLPKRARLNAFGSIGDSLLAGTDDGIFISRDQGHTWTACPGAASTSGRIISIGAAGKKVFAGTDGRGLLESSDGGISWIQNEALASRKVRTILGHGEEIYAGTDADGVFVSNDGGRNWQHLQQGLPPQAQVFALARVKDRVFAGLYSKGLYTWEENEQRWHKTGSVSPLVLATAGETLVAGHNPGGIYTSGDLGATWIKAGASSAGDFTSPVSDGGELPGDAPVWELAADSKLAVAGAGSGIYYSIDKGRSWIRARHGLPEEKPGIAFLVREDFVLAATAGTD